jgi:hypothetical protein
LAKVPNRDNILPLRSVQFPNVDIVPLQPVFPLARVKSIIVPGASFRGLSVSFRIAFNSHRTAASAAVAFAFGVVLPASGVLGTHLADTDVNSNTFARQDSVRMIQLQKDSSHSWAVKNIECKPANPQTMSMAPGTLTARRNSCKLEKPGNPKRTALMGLLVTFIVAASPVALVRLLWALTVPGFAITSPVTGQQVSGDIVISATTDNTAAAEIEYRIGSLLIGTVKLPSTAIVWNTGYASDGS